MMKRLISMLALALAASPAFALEYQLQILAREGDTIGGRVIGGLDGIDLADNGLVAFAGNSGSVDVVWSPTAVLAAEGASFGGVTLPGFNTFTIQINNNGDVAVVHNSNSSSNSDSGVYTAAGRIGGGGATIDGNTLTTVVGSGIHLANDGTVTFFNGIDDGRRGIFTQSSLLVADGDTVGSTVVSLSLLFNKRDGFDVDANGVPYFYSEISGTSTRVLMTPSGEIFAHGDAYSGDTVGNLNSSDVAVSETGLAALAGTLGSSSTYFIGDTNGTIVTSSTVVLYDFDINSDGTLAYVNHNDDGVYTQDDAILEAGDSLEGLTFISAVANTVTIIDSGQIAFIGVFEDRDGNQFDAAVQATVIPEPASLALLGLGGVAMLARRRPGQGC